MGSKDRAQSDPQTARRGGLGAKPAVAMFTSNRFAKIRAGTFDTERQGVEVQSQDDEGASSGLPRNNSGAADSAVNSSRPNRMHLEEPVAAIDGTGAAQRPQLLPE
jgi:hypothetical protein